jgi:hypothetical protein
MNDRYLHVIGQVGGYGAGLAAWLNLAKDFIGLIGIIAGATLSVWALIDRIRKANKSNRK